MYIVIFCSLLALLFTYLESTGKMKHGMALGVSLVTFLGMIHYDYGNDYMSYYNLFHHITSLNFDIDTILSKDYYRDPGWVLLCFLFKHLGGFFVMVATLNIIQNIIVYHFIKNNVELAWRPFAIFIYLFVTSYYLMSFSMMRQFFVAIIFLWTWKYIVHRKWLIASIIIYLSSFVHGSGIVLLPFAFWGFIPMNKSKYFGIGYAILLIILWVFNSKLNDIFLYSISLDDSFSEYANRYDSSETKLKLGLGFVINMIPFILSIRFLLSKNKKYTYQMKSLVALGAIAFLIEPFAQVIRLITRICIYFGIFSIASLPLIYDNINNRIIRLIFISLYILITIYNYYLFFHTGVYAEHYSVFKTIFNQ